MDPSVRMPFLVPVAVEPEQPVVVFGADDPFVVTARVPGNSEDTVRGVSVEVVRGKELIIGETHDGQAVEAAGNVLGIAAAEIVGRMVLLGPVGPIRDRIPVTEFDLAGIQPELKSRGGKSENAGLDGNGSVEG